ncbi:30S ribosomal protein S15 [Buchnera aphidicola]|uniref:Small ribosomal subunit protein uS15 n=1 Tax=Buchnera aphidicola (Sarucallis kahawaluokalani) TaxID=1241878 RepID=A0A4D6YI55_9GAMM|nr:30S ribosomal protein S15 [Buchnera aphidicola]QCI26041.1 30S ribosomal protein S15 [Buchnera aphidicola (Sarucallis kahawaluokalani)]
MKNLKKKIILTYSTNIKNTGLSEVQIAMLSARINFLKKHFDIHQKDFSSKRGLLKIVSQRRKLLNYLKNTNTIRYNNILKKLELRH